MQITLRKAKKLIFIALLFYLSKNVKMQSNSHQIIRNKTSNADKLLDEKVMRIWVYKNNIIIDATNSIYNVHISHIVDANWEKYGIIPIKFNIKFKGIICEQFIDVLNGIYPQKDELARQRFINEFKSCEFI